MSPSEDFSENQRGASVSVESVGSALGFSSTEDEVDVSVGVFSKVN